MQCDSYGLLATATSYKQKRTTVSEMRPRRGVRSSCGGSKWPRTVTLHTTGEANHSNIKSARCLTS